MISRPVRLGAAGLALALLAGCATGHAVHAGDEASKKGEWDAAVAHYREALGDDPTRVDVKISLARAMQAAAAEHLRRAKTLEAQDQPAGAIAEYHAAAEMDPTNTFASAKAAELERQQRERVEATRPASTIERLREQVRQSATIPTLDPRVKVPALKFNQASVRDIVNAIAAFSNPPLNIQYAQSAENLVTHAYSIDAQDLSLEEALNQVLSANGLSFKVINPRSIMVFADTPQEHTKYDDLYTQVFYLSNADPAEMNQTVVQMTTSTANAASRPICAPAKGTTALTCRATGPIMSLIERLIRANDKPKAEVLIEVEILEVDRTRVKQLGLDLSQYAFGLTFSPEVAPPNTGSTPGAYPAQPPPFNLNTISGGISTNDFYVTVPTALVRLLESDNHTRTLAKPSVRGAEGADITMNLGDQIPVLNSTIPSVTTGLGTTAPVTNVTYKPVGVNLTIKPRVTFDDEIILALTVDNSGVGANVNVGGQNLQSFTARTVQTTLRLRDGESNLLAGLIREQNNNIQTGLTGLARIPVLRNIFGNTNETIEQSDVVIVITPHIVRSHELTPDDLKPMYIGTQQNLGQTGNPPLISAETPMPSGVTPPAAQAGAPAPAAGVAPPAANAPPRAVPVVPAPENPPVAPPAPAPPAQPPLIALFSPGTEFQSGASAPYTVPITVANMPDVGTITLHVTYNAAVLRAQAAMPGTFMGQGNVAATFVPRLDTNQGFVDLVFSRPSGASGASGSGLLGSIQFLAMSPGSSLISVTGSASAPGGQGLPVQFGSATVVVR